MCDIYNVVDLLSVKNLWRHDGLFQNCSGYAPASAWVGCVGVQFSVASTPSIHLTRPCSPRFPWPVLAECWVQTFAQTWRSQTRGWRSRLESYCFISWGWYERHSGPGMPYRYISAIRRPTTIETSVTEGPSNICAAKRPFPYKLSVTGGHSFIHSRNHICTAMGKNYGSWRLTVQIDTSCCDTFGKSLDLIEL